MAEETKQQSIFREKNLEALQTPEDLNDYIHVTSPGVWLVLGAVIVLLIGVCIWGVAGHLDTSVQAAVVADETGTVCYVPAAALESVLEEKRVVIGGTGYELAPSALKPEVITENTNIFVIIAGKLSLGDVVYAVPLSEAMDEGVYAGTIITGRLTPMSLLFR